MEQTTNFLRTVLSDEGHFCLVAIKDGKVVQKFYNDVDSVVESAKKFDSRGYNAYFGLSTFKDEKTRSAKNAKLIKSLFLDIDCGKGKPYTTQVDALEALKKFCKKTKLPKPTAMVNSGGGVHVYWGLTKPETKSTWLPVAEKLKAACRQYGLDADPVVTADIARILRVPNTHNFKSDPATAVEIFGKIGACVDIGEFSKALGDPVIDRVKKWASNKNFRRVTDRIAGIKYGKKSFKKLLKLNAKGKGCNQIDRALKNPDAISYPTWIHMLSIVKFCDDAGDNGIYKVSKGYTHYKPSETEKVAESLLAPHTCARFREDYEKGCKGCPYRGKITSPIVLAMESEEAEEEEVITVSNKGDVFDLSPTTIEKHLIPELPKPYFRKASGGVYVRTEDKDGDTVDIKIHDTDLYLTERVKDPQSGPCFVIKHHTHRDGVVEFVVPSVKLSSREELRKAMGENGIHLLPHQLEVMMKYIGAWVDKLVRTVDEIDARTQFGWDDDRNPTSFAVGARLITADGITRNHPSTFTHQYFKYFEPRGTLNEWKKVMDFYKGSGLEEHQFMVGLAFGAPLMSFVDDVHGVIYNLFSSKSGFGKTTGQLVGSSVWGDPDRLVMTGSSTGNSIWNRTEVMKNIMMYVDEISNYSGIQLSNFAYDSYFGHQKARLSSEGQNKERYQGEKWNLTIGTTANTNIIDKITEFRKVPAGEAQRVMDIQAYRKFDSADDRSKTLQLNRRLQNNHGIACDIYIQQLLSDIEKYREKVLDKLLHIGKLAGATPSNRGWIAMSAVTLVGLEVAQEECKFMSWDLRNLEKWSVKQIKRLKEVQGEMEIDIVDFIAEYYEQNLSGVLRIRSDATRQGKNDDGDVIRLIQPDGSPAHSLTMRHEYDVNKLYMLPGHLKEHCLKKNLIYSEIRNMMRDVLNMKAEKCRMGKGTNMRLPPQSTIVVEFDEDLMAERLEKIRAEKEIANDTDIVH